MGGFWATALSSVASYFSSKSANDSTNRSNLRNTRLNNELQDRLSRTGHQREVKDLRAAGLNPILSAKSSGAPQPASAAAKVEPKPSLGSAAINAAQIQLLKSQARKTSAEALNTELQEPYNQALSDVYSSILGVPAVGVKAAGGLASAYGMYRGVKGVSRMLKARKAKNATVSKPKPKIPDYKLQKLRNLHNRKTETRNKFGLRPGEYIDKRTGEIKSRSFRSQALKKSAKKTDFWLRRFGGRRFRFR